MVIWLSLILVAVGQEPPPLRVLTYNIHHAEGIDGVVDLERIAAVIRDVTPDVVCLQEVDRHLPRTANTDMPAQLAKLLDMNVVFGPNYHFDGGEYGNTILTRLPIVRHENFLLPGPDDAEPRGVLRVDVDVNGTAVSVFNTHWGLRPEERLEQARAVRKHVRYHEHVILAGDLNAVPDSTPLKLLRNRLHDSAHVAAPNTDLNTVRNRRIDFILYSPNFKAVRARVIRSEEAKEASDHLPYLADIELRR